MKWVIDAGYDNKVTIEVPDHVAVESVTIENDRKAIEVVFAENHDGVDGIDSFISDCCRNITIPEFQPDQP